ncbi:5-oxoprolinase subunit PxpA [Arenibacter aquaticus]|uniref:5-oxoprolinase subunit PxpA n=1 Tax=Arenibacter aquaticus TaxID=2489054 RepID=A0A3S0IJY7_9FLAO|nr:5-oxoprolinase subunit PxpA [Arenibacter aquaticus]RTE51898.1 5-oxoprolinase subunit PxpA [Arenibacter aquaticus]
MPTIDINCDLGEGIDNEVDIMPMISSCSIACGGHAGNLETMERVVGLAMANGVLVGAHPSYPDKENFGRVSIPISAEALKKSIKEQIESLVTILKARNMELNHIKPHGALYNDIAKDRGLALLFLESVAPYKEKVVLYVPYASEIAKQAKEAGYRIKYEAFADRNYNQDLTLVSRKASNAMIHDPQEVLDHILLMVNRGMVKTATGAKIHLLADTFCIHGDSPSTLQILMYLSQQLPKKQIFIKK